mgnify:CR=1 FL=1
MKKKLIVLMLSMSMTAALVSGCGSTAETAVESTATETVQETATEAETADAESDQEAADKVAALIDQIYVQERNDNTDEQCAEAKAAWDALTDAQKELVTGEEASPEYFGRDTGDASKDDPRNQDEIGENELLVVSFGTSFNDSRAEDIGGIEKALEAAYPDWSVRRAFTAQIIINHVQARDDEVIDNMQQALDRAVANGVKNLVVQPTHLMHGAEYDELSEAVEKYKDKFESVKIAEPLLGEVGSDATVVNEDKKAVAEILTEEAVEKAGYDSLDAAKEEGTAFVFMGHGTSHTAKISYSQMQTQMEQLGYENVFIGTVEGEPEETSCESVIEKIKAAGYKNDQLTSFFICDDDWSKNTEITLVEMDTSSEVDNYIMEDTRLEELLEDEHQKLLFVFDYMTERAFFMELREIIPGKDLDKAVCSKSIGEAPVQIMSFDEMDAKTGNTEIGEDFYGDSEYDIDELDKEGFDGLGDGPMDNPYDDERF